MVRIASFNVENLFARANAFRYNELECRQARAGAYRDVNALIMKPTYSAAQKAKIRDLLVKLDIYTIPSHGAVRLKDTKSPKWAWLRKNRGTFDREPRDETKNVEIIADGRGDWIGWIELAKEPTNEIGTLYDRQGHPRRRRSRSGHMKQASGVGGEGTIAGGFRKSFESVAVGRDTPNQKMKLTGPASQLFETRCHGGRPDTRSHASQGRR